MLGINYQTLWIGEAGGIEQILIVTSKQSFSGDMFNSFPIPRQRLCGRR